MLGPSLLAIESKQRTFIFRQRNAIRRCAAPSEFRRRQPARKQSARSGGRSSAEDVPMLSADATEISAPQTSSGPGGMSPSGPQLGRPYDYPAQSCMNIVPHLQCCRQRVCRRRAACCTAARTAANIPHVAGRSLARFGPMRHSGTRRKLECCRDDRKQGA